MTEKDNDLPAPSRPSLKVSIPIEVYNKRRYLYESNGKQSPSPLNYSHSKIRENQICSATENPKTTSNPPQNNPLQMIIKESEYSIDKNKQLPNKEANTFDNTAYKKLTSDNINSSKNSEHSYDISNNEENSVAVRNNVETMNNEQSCNFVPTLQTTLQLNRDEFLKRSINTEEYGATKNATLNKTMTSHNDKKDDTNLLAQTNKVWVITSEEREILRTMIQRNDSFVNQVYNDDNIIDKECVSQKTSNENEINIEHESHRKAFLCPSENNKLFINGVSNAITNKVIKPAFEEFASMHTLISSDQLKKEENLKSILSQIFETVSEYVNEFSNNETHNVTKTSPIEITGTKFNKTYPEMASYDKIKTLLMQTDQCLQQLQQSLELNSQLLYAKNQLLNNIYQQIQGEGIRNSDPTQVKKSAAANPQMPMVQQVNSSQCSRGIGLIEAPMHPIGQAKSVPGIGIIEAPVHPVGQTKGVPGVGIIEAAVHPVGQTKGNFQINLPGNKNTWYGYRQHPYYNHQNYATVTPQRSGNLYNPNNYPNTPQLQQIPIPEQINYWKSKNIVNHNQYLPY